MDPINTLSQRLDRLEREKRKLRVLGGVLLLGLACLLLVGQAPSQDRMVAANSFVLLGQDGKPRAELAFSSHGLPGVRFYDGGGKYTASFELDKYDRPSLRLWSGDAKGSARLGLEEDGSPHLTLRDIYGRQTLSLQAGSGTSFERETADGKVRVTTGSPSLEITDVNGKPTLILGTYSFRGIPDPEDAEKFRGTTVVPVNIFTYSSALTFFDRKGFESVQITRGGVTIKSPETGTSAILGRYVKPPPGFAPRPAEPTPPSLVFLDARNQPTWKAP